MTTTTPPRTALPTGRDRPRSTLVPATEVVLFGHLAWLGVVWLASTVVYAIVVACVARWGEVDQSLWQSVVAGWQRYVVFGAGVTVATTFLRMLVRNGVTRRTVATAATTTMVVVAVLVGVWQVLGYAAERLVYDSQGWTQALGTDAVFSWGDLPRVGIEHALVIAAYHACGWVVGICFYRWGAVGGLLRLLPALVPAALVEVVLSPDFAGMDTDVLGSWRDRPHLVLQAAAGGLVVAVTVWVARRLTVATAMH